MGNAFNIDVLILKRSLLYYHFVLQFRVLLINYDFFPIIMFNLIIIFGEKKEPSLDNVDYCVIHHSKIFWKLWQINNINLNMYLLLHDTTIDVSGKLIREVFYHEKIMLLVLITRLDHFSAISLLEADCS